MKIVLLFFLLTVELFAKTQKWISPDRALVLTQDHKNDLVLIDNNDGSKWSFAALSPLKSVTWVKSKNIILIIEHIAHGSQAVAIRLTEKGVERREIVPESENCVFDFKSVNQENHILTLTYQMIERSANGVYGKKHDVQIRFNLNQFDHVKK